jgi:hypothetical protein
LTGGNDFSYVLDRWKRDLRVQRGLSLACKKCGTELVIGDYVHTNRSSRSNIYHVKCWQELWQ